MSLFSRARPWAEGAQDYILDPLLFGEIKGPCVARMVWDGGVAPDADGDGDDCIEDE